MCSYDDVEIGGFRKSGINSPVEVGCFTPLFTRFYTSQVVVWVSEPSTVVVANFGHEIKVYII